MEKAYANTKTFIAARGLEATGEWGKALEAYESLHQSAPADTRVIRRLLVLYRKEKSYARELQLINNAIKHYQDTQAAAQKAWLRSHRKLASTNESLARSLQLLDAKGQPVYEDPFISGLRKRKLVVQKRLKPTSPKTKSRAKQR